MVQTHFTDLAVDLRDRGILSALLEKYYSSVNFLLNSNDVYNVIISALFRIQVTRKQ